MRVGHDRYHFGEWTYGHIDDDGRLRVTRPRWIRLRVALAHLLGALSDSVVTAVDRERGVITIGRRP